MEQSLDLRSSADRDGTDDAQHNDALDMFRIGRVLTDFRDYRAAADLAAA